MAVKNKWPVIRFKGFNDEWEEMTIGDIGSFYYGKSAPKWSLEEDAPTPCVRYGELYTKFGATITKTYSRTNINPQKLRFSKGGEILVPRVGEKPEDFGKCCCYLTLANVAIGEMISVFETTQNPLFYTYYFRNLYRQFAKAVEGKNVKNLYYIELEPIAIYRLSLAEQLKIGTFLQNLDSLIILHQRKFDKLITVKKSMLEKMFPKVGSDVPEIRFKGFTDKWVSRKLGVIAETFEYGLNAAAINYDGVNKYIRITDIDDESHAFNTDTLTSPGTDLSLADNYKLKEGDILFARTGASVGKTYYYTSSDGLVYYAGFLIRARLKPLFDTIFIFQNTLTNEYKNFIRLTSQRSGQPGVNAQEYSDFKIMVPTLSEQKQIGKLFSNLDNLINLQKCELEKLKNIKKACLEKMFV